MSCSDVSHRESEAQRLFDYGVELECRNVPDSAVYAYRKAIDLLGDGNTSELTIDLHLRLGNLLRTHHLYGRALQEHRMALKAGKRIDCPIGVAKAMREVGKDFLYQESPDSALVYICGALALAEQEADSIELMAAHNNLSVVYNELNSMDKAIEHAYQSIRLSTDSVFIYSNYSAIGQMFLQAGQYDSAYYYSLRGSVSSNLYTRANSYKQLCEAARLLGDDQAYERYAVLLDLANDSINKMNRTEVMGETEYRHDLEQVLITEKSRYFRWMAVLIAITMVMVRVYYERKKRRELALKAEVNDLRQEIESREEQTCKVAEEEQLEQNQLSLKVSHEREKLHRLIEMKGDVCARSFMRTKAYKNALLWVDAKSDSVLNVEEQRMVAGFIYKAFAEYIEALRSHLGLTQDEALLCCLVKCGFSTKECAVCKGVSANAIRTQKSRIKSKFS